MGLSSSPSLVVFRNGFVIFRRDLLFLGGFVDLSMFSSVYLSLSISSVS